MDSLIIFDHILAISITLLFPFLLFFWFNKYFKKSWTTLGIGAICYFLINLLILGVMLPVSIINNDFPAYFLVIFLGLVPGILAAISEEITRYFSIKYFLKNKFNWRYAFLFGLGWGGMESILFGVSKISQLILLADASSTYIFPFAIGRVATLFGQIALSIIMIQCFIKSKKIYFLYALSLHLLINILGVLIFKLTPQTGNLTHLIAFIFSLILLSFSIYIISHFDDGGKFRKKIKNIIKFS